MYLARALVDHPDDVRVSVIQGDDQRTLYRLDVHPDDAGRVIGRGGRVARAIRIVAKTAAVREGSRIAVQIGEPRPQREE
ncbi:MAG: KH domain-containing protein [Actinomycetota bacterium]